MVNYTVIGSYPAEINNLDFMKSYFKNNEIGWDSYIKKAVDDQIKAGLDIISDGQTRDPFVNIFYRKLKGCRIRDRGEVIDKVEFVKPITIDDQKMVRKLLPKHIKLIGLLTGAFTLMKSSVDLYYHDEKELCFDFAYALKKEIKLLQKTVDMISIDEPFFSIYMPDYAHDLIHTIIHNVEIPIRLHVCGDVSKIIPNLLDLPVDILSHEFKASPRLFSAFKDYSISKKICLGSVRSDNPKIESIEEIRDHINTGIQIFGKKIDQIAPDCGLRFLTPDIAFQKIKNMVKAGEQIYD